MQFIAFCLHWPIKEKTKSEELPLLQFFTLPYSLIIIHYSLIIDH